eukprot:PhM_4_TR15070/c0_g1_i1/m.54703
MLSLDPDVVLADHDKTFSGESALATTACGVSPVRLFGLHFSGDNDDQSKSSLDLIIRRYQHFLEGGDSHENEEEEEDDAADWAMPTHTVSALRTFHDIFMYESFGPAVLDGRLHRDVVLPAARRTCAMLDTPLEQCCEGSDGTALRPTVNPTPSSMSAAPTPMQRILASPSRFAQAMQRFLTPSKSAAAPMSHLDANQQPMGRRRSSVALQLATPTSASVLPTQGAAFGAASCSGTDGGLNEFEANMVISRALESFCLLFLVTYEAQLECLSRPSVDHLARYVSAYCSHVIAAGHVRDTHPLCIQLWWEVQGCAFHVTKSGRSLLRRRREPIIPVSTLETFGVKSAAAALVRCSSMSSCGGTWVPWGMLTQCGAITLDDTLWSCPSSNITLYGFKRVPRDVVLFFDDYTSLRPEDVARSPNTVTLHDPKHSTVVAASRGDDPTDVMMALTVTRPPEGSSHKGRRGAMAREQRRRRHSMDVCGAAPPLYGEDDDTHPHRHSNAFIGTNDDDALEEPRDCPKCCCVS